MSLSHHSLVAWQRADDLFIKLHQLSLQDFRRTNGTSWAPKHDAPHIPWRRTSLKDLHDAIEEHVCIFSTSRSRRSRRWATAFTLRYALGAFPKHRRTS